VEPVISDLLHLQQIYSEISPCGCAWPAVVRPFEQPPAAVSPGGFGRRPVDHRNPCSSGSAPFRTRHRSESLPYESGDFGIVVWARGWIL